MLTAEGRRQGLEFLGVAQLRPKTTWAVLRKTYLPARALGLPAASDALFKALSSEPAFQAVLLKQQYDLATAEIPKPDEATDALAWKLIGFENETDGNSTPRTSRPRYSTGRLGNGRAADFKKAATRLLAQRVGARRDDPKELRDCSLCAAGSTRTRAVQPPPNQWRCPLNRRLNPLPRPAFDLPSFAEHVKSAARDCPTGRFGDNKVFIAHVWKALQADPTFADHGAGRFQRTPRRG